MFSEGADTNASTGLLDPCGGFFILVSCQTCNVAINMIYFLHNQPRGIEYEEIHCDSYKRRT